MACQGAPLSERPHEVFRRQRLQLPGQEVPGLGLAHEAGEMLRRMARRLELAGVAFNPAWPHTAYAARHHFRFVDDARQGRFLALLRDLAALPLAARTRAVAEDRVLLDRSPYAWEADDMVSLFDVPRGGPWSEAITAERDARRFSLRSSDRS